MNTLRTVINAVKTNSPFLYYATIVNLILVPLCLIGLAVDDRTLMGINIWIKPFKFAISTVIYIFSVGFLSQLYPFSKRKRSIINNTVAFTLTIEMYIIFAQAFRGIKSHYNMETPLDGMLFAAMGILIGINVMIMGFFVIETIRLKMNTTKAVQWSILLGWLLIIAGSWVGGQMIGQMSHNVGVMDGGPGLPLLNWSTIAGDLRVAHFFGIHGLQIIPLFAYVLSQKWKASQAKHIGAVSLFAFSYVAWVMFTFYQAQQGMALLALQISENAI